MASIGGNYYFGPAQDLINLSACSAFLNGKTLSADTIFTLIGNSVDNSTCTFTGINMSAYDLTFTSENAISRFNQNRCGINATIAFNQASTDRKIKIKNLNIFCNNSYVFSIAGNQQTTYYIYNNTICFTQNTTSRLLANPINSNPIYIFNNKFYSNVNTASITTTSVTSPIYIENNTFYSKYGSQIDVGSNTFLRNNLCYQQISNTAQVDNTLTVSSTYINYSLLGDFNGNVSGYDFTGVFSSVVSSDDDFLDITGNRSVISAGLPSLIDLNTVGIRQNRRPGLDGYYSIGADEYGALNYISFEINQAHSPSPAYLRLTDTSVLDDYTDDYTRIWGITNNRTSATTYYSTSAITYDFSISGVHGDTFNISLSANY